MAHFENWQKHWCPACNAVNWISLGDLNDLTVADTVGFECHGCKKQIALLADEDFDPHVFGTRDGEDEDDGPDEFYDKGKAQPD